MANPQIADGYTKIANEIMDALIAAHLSGQEMSVALFVIRKTYGFNKTEDFIALSQMMAAVGMSKIRASQVVRSLELMKILTVKENINGLTKKYSLNKDFDTWDTVKEKLNRKEKTKQTVKVLRNRPLRKTLTTKDNITKDNITKENIPPIVPQKTDGYSDEFLKFWKAYPKKSGSKKSAFINWKKLNGDKPPIDTILSAINRQIVWRERAGPNDFRPEWKDPERWIKHRMWESEVEIPEKTKDELGYDL